MKTRFLKIQLIFVMLLLSMKLMADAVYPIVLNPQLLPPYSNCLLDYAASRRFNVYVLNRDMNHSSYSFILSIKMKQGNSYLIDDKVKAVQFTVSSGIPTIVDITPLLNHVKDIKNNGFRYEEGAYEFVFQAFDATNPQIAVSEPAYLMAYLSQSEPPVCTYPNDNDCISPLTGGVINFSWIESVAAVPDPSRKFKFEIYEMPDNLFNDSMDYSTRQRKARMNSLVNTQVPIFSDETSVPFYSFVNTTGRLQKNHTYLWRVQIFKDGTNPNGQYTTSGYYKNNGWSEPFTLRYRNCNPWSEPVVVQQEKRSNEEAPELNVDVNDQVTISWETNPEKFCGYRVGYNVKGQDSIIEWTTQTFSQNESSWVISKNITPGVDYVARIEGITDCRDTTYTNPKKTDFSMQKKVNNDCVSNISEISLNDNIEELKSGDIIDACGKSVRVTSVTRNNDGSFEGEGVALLPILSDLTGIKVSFENIKVNSAKELTSGNIVSIKGNNTLTLNVNGLVNKQNAGNKTKLQETIAQTKSSSSPNASSISLSDNKVSVSNIPVGSIVDNNELAGVDDNTKVGENGNITFSAKENGNPVFDNGKEPFNGLQIDDYYKISGQWIALETGKSATLVAKLTKGDSINLDSVSIYIQAEKDAVKIENIKWSATKECEFTIFAGNETEHLNLIAVDKSKGSYNVLGRAFIQSMKHEDITLHLVPVRRDPSTIDTKAISEYLDAVYNPLGKYFTVKLEEQFDKEEKLEFLNDGLDVTETSLLSTESEDMKLLLQAYTEEHTIKDSNEAYIFICPSANDINVKGDMPRNKGVGYVFSSASKYGTETDARTIAHEIGHGIFDLEHTFDFGVQKGTTTNLMDYTQKTDTKVWQWSVMDNHPSYTLPFLEDAEDAQWTTDGHYYLFTYIGMLMGLSYEKAEEYGRWAEKPDTYILTNDDIDRGYVLMGNNDTVNVKSPLPGYTFSLSESQITPNVVSTGREMNIVDYKVKTLEGYTFYLSDNYKLANVKPQITLTQSALIEKEMILGRDQNNQPVYLFIPYYSEGNMLENTTWAIGGLQQRNHALTGGYHGVELAFTAYAIKHAKDFSMQDDVETYLLHRFGDVFAHFDKKLDSIGFSDDVSLKDYIGWLEAFLNSHIIATGKTPSGETLKEKGVYFHNSIFYSTYSRKETIKIILNSILTADSKIKRYNSQISNDSLSSLILDYRRNLDAKEKLFYGKVEGASSDGISREIDLWESFKEIVTHKELHSFFLKELDASVSAIQNKYVMYGDQVTCNSSFTSGHSKDNGEPDEILRRKKLFILYVQRVTELYPMLEIFTSVNAIKNPVDIIQEVLDWHKGDSLTDAKLDGVFKFLIEIEKFSKSKEDSYVIYIPIKSLPKEVDKGLVWWMYSKLGPTFDFDWNFDKAAREQTKTLNNYLDEIHKEYKIVKQERLKDNYKFVIQKIKH